VSHPVGAVPALIAAVANAASIASSGAPAVSTCPVVALWGQRALVIVRGLDPPLCSARSTGCSGFLRSARSLARRSRRRSRWRVRAATLAASGVRRSRPALAPADGRRLKPSGRLRVRDRLGMWITAFRDGYNGRWRLLEAPDRVPVPRRSRRMMMSWGKLLRPAIDLYSFEGGSLSELHFFARES
jgi:hypothetical protein